ncbi:MAG: phosphoribosylglycinamide formyltransferase, partial [bacterium]
RIPAVVVDHKLYSNQEDYETEVIRQLKDHGVELVCLAGYMKIVSLRIINEFKGKMMNIHPALLPSFPGLQVQKKALDYGAKVSGCTVHFVDEGTDTGPIIMQSVVPIIEDDTVESLSARIIKEEHKIYPKAIDLFAKGRLVIDGRRVKVLGIKKSNNL